MWWTPIRARLGWIGLVALAVAPTDATARDRPEGREDAYEWSRRAHRSEEQALEAMGSEARRALLDPPVVAGPPSLDDAVSPTEQVAAPGPAEAPSSDALASSEASSSPAGALASDLGRRRGEPGATPHGELSWLDRALAWLGSAAASSSPEPQPESPPLASDDSERRPQRADTAPSVSPARAEEHWLEDWLGRLASRVPPPEGMDDATAGDPAPARIPDLGASRPPGTRVAKQLSDEGSWLSGWGRWVAWLDSSGGAAPRDRGEAPASDVAVLAQVEPPPVRRLPRTTSDETTWLSGWGRWAAWLDPSEGAAPPDREDERASDVAVLARVEPPPVRRLPRTTSNETTWLSGWLDWLDWLAPVPLPHDGIDVAASRARADAGEAEAAQSEPPTTPLELALAPTPDPSATARSSRLPDPPAPASSAPPPNAATPPMLAPRRPEARAEPFVEEIASTVRSAAPPSPPARAGAEPAGSLALERRSAPAKRLATGSPTLVDRATRSEGVQSSRPRAPSVASAPPPRPEVAAPTLTAAPAPHATLARAEAPNRAAAASRLVPPGRDAGGETPLAATPPATRSLAATAPVAWTMDPVRGARADARVAPQEPGPSAGRAPRATPIEGAGSTPDAADRTRSHGMWTERAPSQRASRVASSTPDAQEPRVAAATNPLEGSPGAVNEALSRASRAEAQPAPTRTDPSTRAAVVAALRRASRPKAMAPGTTKRDHLVEQSPTIPVQPAAASAPRIPTTDGEVEAWRLRSRELARAELARVRAALAWQEHGGPLELPQRMRATAPLRVASASRGPGRRMPTRASGRERAERRASERALARERAERRAIERALAREAAERRERERANREAAREREAERERVVRASRRAQSRARPGAWDAWPHAHDGHCDHPDEPFLVEECGPFGCVVLEIWPEELW